MTLTESGPGGEPRERGPSPVSVLCVPTFPVSASVDRTADDCASEEDHAAPPSTTLPVTRDELTLADYRALARTPGGRKRIRDWWKLWCATPTAERAAYFDALRAEHDAEEACRAAARARARAERAAAAAAKFAAEKAARQAYYAAVADAERRGKRFAACASWRRPPPSAANA